MRLASYSLYRYRALSLCLFLFWFATATQSRFIAKRETPSVNVGVAGSIADPDMVTPGRESLNQNISSKLEDEFKPDTLNLTAAVNLTATESTTVVTVQSVETETTAEPKLKVVNGEQAEATTELPVETVNQKEAQITEMGVEAVKAVVTTERAEEAVKQLEAAVKTNAIVEDELQLAVDHKNTTTNMPTNETELTATTTITTTETPATTKITTAKTTTTEREEHGRSMQFGSSTESISFMPAVTPMKLRPLPMTTTTSTTTHMPQLLAALLHAGVTVTPSASLENSIEEEQVQPQSEKRAKYISDNSTNAQQLTLPNVAEAWSLASMKMVPATTTTSATTTTAAAKTTIGTELGNDIEPQQAHNETEQHKEKNLLDWQQIMMMQTSQENRTEPMMSTTLDATEAATHATTMKLEMATVEGNREATTTAQPELLAETLTAKPALTAVEEAVTELSKSVAVKENLVTVAVKPNLTETVKLDFRAEADAVKDTTPTTITTTEATAPVIQSTAETETEATTTSAITPTTVMPSELNATLADTNTNEMAMKATTTTTTTTTTTMPTTTTAMPTTTMPTMALENNENDDKANNVDSGSSSAATSSDDVINNVSVAVSIAASTTETTPQATEPLQITVSMQTAGEVSTTPATSTTTTAQSTTTTTTTTTEPTTTTASPTLALTPTPQILHEKVDEQLTTTSTLPTPTTTDTVQISNEVNLETITVKNVTNDNNKILPAVETEATTSATNTEQPLNSAVKIETEQALNSAANSGIEQINNSTINSESVQINNSESSSVFTTTTTTSTTTTTITTPSTLLTEEKVNNKLEEHVTALENNNLSETAATPATTTTTTTTAATAVVRNSLNESSPTATTKTPTTARTSTVSEAEYEYGDEEQEQQQQHIDRVEQNSLLDKNKMANITSTTTTTTTIPPTTTTIVPRAEQPVINLLDDSTTSTTTTRSTSTSTTTTTTPRPTTTTTTPTTTVEPIYSSTNTTASTFYNNSDNMLPVTTTTESSVPSNGMDLPTMQMPMPHPNPTDMDHMQQPHGNNTGTDVNVIIAITVSVIGVVALILLVAFLYLMRKRQKQMSYTQRCRPVSLDAYSLDNVSVLGSVRRKGRDLRASKRTYGNAAFDDPSLRHNLLSATELSKFLERRSSIFEEFRDVPQIIARADEVPTGCEDKNRYANVIPLPETRVVLQRLGDDDKTEYINANYVRGPRDAPNYYIACQAPLESTTGDFWRMIWEQQSRVIVQATDLNENGIERCAEYLPPSVTLDNHSSYGDYQVTLKNREVKDKYAISTLMLKRVDGDECRELTHYWYKWPETGVPMEEAPIIAMLLEARSSLKSYALEQANELKEKSSTLTIKSLETAMDGDVKKPTEEECSTTSSNEINGNVTSKTQRGQQGPLTIHCSPGTGRTGTIIACDMAIRSLETPKRSVDIPQLVYYVRRGRASAVQTKDQYEFIYKVANMYATKITNLSNDN